MCYSITCEDLESKCSEKSDLELKIILSDNCSKLLILSSPLKRTFGILWCEWWILRCLQAKKLLYSTSWTLPWWSLQDKRFRSCLCLWNAKVNFQAFLKVFRCGTDGFCESVGHDGECAQSADCPSYQYCNMGKCANYKKIGDPCFHRNECGRSATCFYRDGSSITGVCT